MPGYINRSSRLRPSTDPLTIRSLPVAPGLCQIGAGYRPLGEGIQNSDSGARIQGEAAQPNQMRTDGTQHHPSPGSPMPHIRVRINACGSRHVVSFPGIISRPSTVIPNHLIKTVWQGLKATPVPVYRLLSDFEAH